MRPKVVSPGSIMPAYAWLKGDRYKIDYTMIPKKIRAMQTLGVPYKKGYDQVAIADLKKQATLIATDIVETSPKEALKGISKEALIKELENKKIIALIAYLQRLGTDIKTTKK
jgi:cytochrome c oxidase cbb3-type subunit I/II